MADVKFSELTSLAAADVATDDIFAIVDTDATTSKKLTVANLMGQVPSGAPLHINDTTDSSSSTTGAISTDGGLGVTLKSTLTGLVTVGTGIVPDASDGAYLGTTALQFSDLFLADGAVINLGDDQDVTLTHVADTGVLLNSSMALQFRDSALSISSSTDGQLDIDADTEVEITTTTVDLNGALDVSGLSTLGGNLTLSATNPVISIGASPNAVTLTHSSDGLTLDTNSKLFFRDSAISVGSSTDGQMEIAADTEVQIDTGTVDVNGAVDISGNVTGAGNLTLSATNPVISLGASPNAITLTHSTAGITIDGDHQFLFRDAALGVNSSTDGQLDIFADSTVEITLGGTAVHTFAIDGGGAYNVAFKHSRDAQDLLFQQADGVEVARIHDGGTTPASGLTAYATGLGGFGHKKNVMKIDATSANKDVTLTVAESGSIILCDASNASYDIDITLPTGSTGMEGIHYYFVCSAAVHSSKTIDIATVGTDGNDKIFLALNLAGTTSASVTGDILTIGNSAPLGTMVKCTLMSAGASGAAEIWMAEAFQPSGSALVSVA